ncbi:hypothetical protein ACFQ0G_11395 [Streptomyces chiangmaiensis]
MQSLPDPGLVPVPQPVRADNPVTLRDLRVLVDEAAEAIPPDDTRWAIDGRRFGRPDTVGHRCPSDR